MRTEKHWDVCLADIGVKAFVMNGEVIGLKWKGGYLHKNHSDLWPAGSALLIKDESLAEMLPLHTGQKKHRTHLQWRFGRLISNTKPGR